MFGIAVLVLPTHMLLAALSLLPTQCPNVVFWWRNVVHGVASFWWSAHGIGPAICTVWFVHVWNWAILHVCPKHPKDASFFAVLWGKYLSYPSSWDFFRSSLILTVNILRTGLGGWWLQGGNCSWQWSWQGGWWLGSRVKFWRHFWTRFAGGNGNVICYLDGFEHLQQCSILELNIRFWNETLVFDGITLEPIRLTLGFVCLANKILQTSSIHVSKRLQSKKTHRHQQSSNQQGCPNMAQLQKKIELKSNSL